MLPDNIRKKQSKQIANIMKQATKRTERGEKALIREMTATYKQSLKEVKSKLAIFIEKYGVDDKLTPAEAYKFDRLAKLEKSITEELNKVTKTVNTASNAHLADTLTDNYYSTGFALESAAQFKIGYNKLNAKAVKEALHRPIDKLAIQNNAIQVKQNIKRSLAQSVVQGEGIKKTAKRIQQDLEKNANNALRIAQTEQTRIMNTSRIEASQRADNKGLKINKVWVATLDERTRTSHVEVDGESVPLDKPFSNGLMYAGDPSGSAAEVINCRCTTTEEVEGYPSVDAERNARDAYTGKSKVIDATSVEQWKKERLS